MNAKFLQSALLAVMTLVGSAPALAASITYETRLMTDFSIPGNGNYLGWWNEQPGAVNGQSLTSFTNVVVPGGLADTTSPADDVFSHLEVSFFVPRNTTWRIQIAPDAGHGGALYFGNSSLASYTWGSDMWWGGNWGNLNALLRDSVAGGANGRTVTFNAYWAEGCCNGGQSARFSTDDGMTWQDLSVANLEAAAPVPVPAAVWLMLSAIAGLTFSGRRRIGH